MNFANILLCVTGTIGFCSILNMPKNKITFVAIGASISSFIQELLLNQFEFSVFASTACASLAIGIYSEIIARIKKTPSTVILLPSTIPLLPGGSLYYAMSALMNAEYKNFITHSSQTINTGFGIAVGTILTSIIIQILYYIKNKLKT